MLTLHVCILYQMYVYTSYVNVLCITLQLVVQTQLMAIALS